MNDFDYEVMQRKRIAGGARHRKCGGKSKHCSLPTDFMTPKQWRERCGSVVTYQLNQPIPWETFKNMPQDIQRSYVEKIFERFSPTATDFARIFGVTATTVTKYFGANLSVRFSPGKKMPKDRTEDFEVFLNQMDKVGENVLKNIQDKNGLEPVHHANMDSSMRMSGFSLVFDGMFDIEAIHNSIASMIPNGSKVHIDIKCDIDSEFFYCENS